MKHFYLLICCAVLLLIAGCDTTSSLRTSEPPEEPLAEMRGVLVDPQSWGHPEADTMKVRISRMMQQIADTGFHSVFFQVREQAESFYPSDLEPWSKLFNYRYPGFDPLRYAIEEAHRRGLQFHARVDLLSLSGEALPEDESHLYFQHGPGAAEKDRWSVIQRDGDYYLNPALPEVKTYLKEVIRRLVKDYELDGLHLDYLYNLEPDFFYDPHSVARFEQDSMKSSVSRGDWVRRQVAGLAEAIAVEALLLKPYLLISTKEGEIYEIEGVKRREASIVIDMDDPNKNLLSVDLRRYAPEQIVALKLSASGYSVSEGVLVRAGAYSTQKIPDSEGYIGLILPKLPDTLFIIQGKKSVGLSTRSWLLPYRYTVGEEGGVHRAVPWVEFRRGPEAVTSDQEYDLLCKTEYPARVYIEGDTVKQYRTGIFFKEIHLKEGPNRVSARAIFTDSSEAFYEREYTCLPGDKSRKAFPLWIDESSVTPATDMVLLPDDVVRLSFRGSKGQRARAVVRPRPGKAIFPFSREDHDDYTIYRADLPLNLLKKKDKPHTITIVLESVDPVRRGERIKWPLEVSLTIRELYELPLIRTTEDKAVLTYNLGPIRLGGPIINELPAGVTMQVSGKTGDHYRVCLNGQESGFIHESSVEVLPAGDVKPAYYLQSVQTRPGDGADILSIPYPEAVPFAVLPQPHRQRILINLYGVKTSSTWMVHRAGLSTIDRVTWRQPDPETYQLVIHLASKRIWGYTLEPEEGRLVFRLKHPPVLEIYDGKPSLRGLKVSIEAGHGGHNTGARGLSGLLEKDVNLDVALRLEELCRAKGMEVLQVRSTDTYMTLEDKRSMVEASDADIHVSIHANAGGGGYLRVGGVSTYYHNPFWAGFAEVMYGKLLELGLDEFGVVGSFNYRVTRMGSRPSILVEQAFLSHAEDEERLASPDFRQRMAKQILAGIEAYVIAEPLKD